jgi:hypothetical protein
MGNSISKFWESAASFPLITFYLLSPTCKVPFSSEDALHPLLFRPVYPLDSAFFLFYDFSIKKEILIKYHSRRWHFYAALATSKP